MSEEFTNCCELKDDGSDDAEGGSCEDANSGKDEDIDEGGGSDDCREDARALLVSDIWSGISNLAPALVREAIASASASASAATAGGWALTLNEEVERGARMGAKLCSKLPKLGILPNALAASGASDRRSSAVVGALDAPALAVWGLGEGAVGARTLRFLNDMKLEGLTDFKLGKGARILRSFNGFKLVGGVVPAEGRGASSMLKTLLSSLS